MRKNRLVVLFMCFVLLCSMAGCGVPQEDNTETDYSKYEFVDVTWVREGDCDTETLRFLSDGNFRYSCACGNSVNDADLVKSYTYDDATKTFTLHCLEESDGMITEIKLISCDGNVLELDFDGVVRRFVVEGTESGEEKETQKIPEIKEENTKFNVDLTKTSPIIEELADESVVKAARSVVDAFLSYEDSVAIEVKGNKQRFMTDMAYIINCTCPLFEAFADFNEMTAYDASTGTVSWKYRVTKEEFQTKVQEFIKVTEEYLSPVRVEDSEAMRAILLYQGVTEDLEYDYGLIGDAYNQLSEEEASLRESSYNVLVNKSGICTNNAQALVFLYTQAGLGAGTVLHTGGQGMHMWNVVLIDGKYYYCDPTFDIGCAFDYFGITAADRASWAGGYSADEGTMLGTIIPDKYDITDTRFEILRTKMPVELSDVKVDHESQKITFYGYEYEYTFEVTR